MKPVAFLWERHPLPGGATRPIEIDFSRYCHILTVGGSGSGKSMASLLLTAKVSLHNPSSKVWILDYKGDSDTFGFLNNGVDNSVSECRYWQYSDCMKGLEDYYSMFQKRLSNDPDQDKGFRLLWCDEWASFILNLPKKEAEAAKSMLSTVLMMGRSKRCQVLMSTQKAMMEIFSSGSRDNFSVCLAMGNISKESAAMLGFSRDEFLPVTEIGGGHLLLGGRQLPVQVPFIGPRGMARMKEDILRAVTR